MLEERLLGPAPALIAHPARPIDAAVLWFHGFGVGKETHRPELLRFASAGLLAVGIDAAGHGARRLPDLAERQAAPREEAKATMLELARATAAEVPAILDALGMERVAIAGVSMGGYIVYGALDPRLRAAVSILGNPELLGDREPPVPLLSITGECDENVPPHAARQLHERFPAHRYVELAGEPHLVSEAGWRTAIELTVEWIAGHL